MHPTSVSETVDLLNGASDEDHRPTSGVLEHRGNALSHRHAIDLRKSFRAPESAALAADEHRSASPDRHGCQA
jgi:hypothetical protein